MMREKKSESDKINFASCKHEPPNDRGRYFYSFYYYHVSCVILLAMATLWEETLNLAPLACGASLKLQCFNDTCRNLTVRASHPG